MIQRKWGCPTCKKFTKIELVETVYIKTNIEFNEEGGDSHFDSDEAAEIDWDTCNFEYYYCKECLNDFITPIELME
jgi:hypothetical protein